MVTSYDDLTSDDLRAKARALRDGDYDEEDFDSDDEVEKKICELEEEASRRARVEEGTAFWKDVKNGKNPWDGSEGYDIDENL